MREIVLKHALINAVRYSGKAKVGAVMGKVLAEKPELKSKIEEVRKICEEIVKEVNAMSLDEQKKMMEDLGIEIVEKEYEQKLPELPCVKNGVVMRMAPFPSGPLHIGNARMAVLNDEYVKRYGGKLLLVIDDTIGSEEKTIDPDAYELIIDGLRWLGIEFHEVYYKSDRLEIFYEFAERLIKEGIAYVCECDAETLREKRRKGEECEHRNRSVEENLKKWKEMLEGKFREGEAVLRLKTDMKHPDPAFRDRVLCRIVEREHPRVGKKYRVWPMLEFSWAVDDQVLGITHILRGKDLIIEDMVEEYIWDKLGMKKPHFIHYGLFRLEGVKLSKSYARKAIEKGEYIGWDDPRTWSLQALRRRGIQPQAIRNFVLKLGLSLADIVVPVELLYSENRKIIDPIANRYFAVFDPVEIEVVGAPEITSASAPLHPDFPERGKRSIPVNLKKIYIERSDLENYEGRVVRLMDLCNVRLGKKSEYVGKELTHEIPKIHWVSEPNVEIEVVMDDCSIKKGIAEPSVGKLKEGDLVQFVREFFCRTDEVGERIRFFYTHD